MVRAPKIVTYDSHNLRDFRVAGLNSPGGWPRLSMNSIPSLPSRPISYSAMIHLFFRCSVSRHQSCWPGPGKVHHPTVSGFGFRAPNLHAGGWTYVLL